MNPFAQQTDYSDIKKIRFPHVLYSRENTSIFDVHRCVPLYTVVHRSLTLSTPSWFVRLCASTACASTACTSTAEWNYLWFFPNTLFSLFFIEGEDSILRLLFLNEDLLLTLLSVTCNRHELVTSPYLLTARKTIGPQSSLCSFLMTSSRLLLLSSYRLSSAKESFSPSMYHSISIGGYPVSKHNKCNSVPAFFWTLNGSGVTIWGCNNSSVQDSYKLMSVEWEKVMKIKYDIKYVVWNTPFKKKLRFLKTGVSENTFKIYWTKLEIWYWIDQLTMHFSFCILLYLQNLCACLISYYQRCFQFQRLSSFWMMLSRAHPFYMKPSKLDACFLFKHKPDIMTSASNHKLNYSRIYDTT